MTNGKRYALFFLLNDSRSRLVFQFLASQTFASQTAANNALVNELINGYTFIGFPLFTASDFGGINFGGLFSSSDGGATYHFTGTEPQIAAVLNMNYSGGNCPKKSGEVKIIAALLAADPDS